MLDRRELITSHDYFLSVHRAGLYNIKKIHREATEVYICTCRLMVKAKEKKNKKMFNFTKIIFISGILLTVLAACSFGVLFGPLHASCKLTWYLNLDLYIISCL